MMPSSIVRASENGRPFLPVGRGSIPSINDHWASDSNWNRDTIPDSQPDPELFIRHALGALGELEVGRLLDQLDSEWFAFHAVPVGSAGSDVDHIVIGPGGVFTINSK